MDVRKLADGIFVAGQIDPSDLAAIAAQGFRAIICNRPDGEAADQPSFGQIEAAAAAHGLEVRYLPVRSSTIGDTEIDAFETATGDLPKPILAYCRSGTRCTVLWSLSQASRRPVDDIVTEAAAAGYDMTPLIPRLEAIAQK